LNKGKKEGHPLKRRYFTAIGLPGVKRLKTGTDMLPIITSTGDVLLSGINIDDLE